MSRALTLVVLAGVCVSYVLASCGAVCKVNTECTDPNCDLCMGGKCASGCGGGCSKSTDCGDLNCRVCTDQICQNSPQHLCGGSCKKNSDCSQDGSNNCQNCFTTTGQCTAGCGKPCDNSTQCLNTTCQHCILNQCSAGNVPCGGQCKVDLDCTQSSVCNSCVAGLCGAGCSKQCNVDTDCIDTNCKYCVTGTGGQKACAHTQNGKKCHDRCRVDTDCTGSPGTCASCVQFKCGSPCGKPCIASSDCITAHCNTCTSNSTCGPP